MTTYDLPLTDQTCRECGATFRTSIGRERCMSCIAPAWFPRDEQPPDAGRTVAQMTAQHTPGPWGVSMGKLNIGTYIEGMWITVADVPRKEYIVERPIEQREADARLIAAAPDLLAACEAYIALSTLSDPGEFIRALEAVDVQMRTAVANARAAQARQCAESGS